MRELELGGLKVRVTGGDDGHGGGEGPMVVLLHGFGAPGDDLVGLYPALVTPGVRFLFPEAPIELVEYGPAARAWWRLDTAAMQRAAASGEARDLSAGLPDGLQSAHDKVAAMLQATPSTLGGDPRMILGGFSQGAMLSCDVALRTELPLAGLIQLSGTLVAAEIWQPLMAQRQGLAILQSHGRQDPLLPFAAADRLRSMWEQAGAQLVWSPFHGGHEIPMTVVEKLSLFIRAQFDAKPSP